MTNITSNLSAFLIGFSLLMNSCTKSEKKFTNSDLNVVDNLNRYLNPQCIVFLDDGEDVSVMKAIKVFSRCFTVINSTLLESILGNNVLQMSFFQRRTAIVTKQELNLTSLLSKVSIPHYLTWIIFGDHTHFPNLYIPLSSEVIFINTTYNVVSVKRVYHLKPGINATVKSLLSSDLAKSSFDVELQKENFHNVSLDMLVLTPNEACQKIHGESLMRKLECLHQEFLRCMGARLNFSVNVVECMEKEHPFTYPNGSDSELFLKLKNREVDFSAISHVILIRGKRNYMDFVWPTFVLKSMMYLKQGRMAGRWDSYLKPLESSVWWGILLWILLTGILIQIFEKLLVNSLKFEFSLVVGLISSMQDALQVFCNQAMSNLPASYSIRIIYLSEFFVVLIFFQAYCGYLISSLTVIVPKFPFKDLEEFFENQQYQVMTLRRGFHQFFFRKIIGEGRREDFMLPSHELPETVQTAVDKLCIEDHLAFSEFQEDLLNFGRLKCNILKLPSPIANLYVGIAMPKKTPLKEFLRRELLYIRSAGLVERSRSRLSFQTNFQNKNSQEEFATVSMTQIFSIFILLGMGVLLSSFIFIIELLFRRRKRRGSH